MASWFRTIFALAYDHSTQYASEKKPICLLAGTMSRRSSMTCRMTEGKKLCHQYPTKERFGSCRQKVQNAWFACRLARKHANDSLGCRAIISPTWAIDRFEIRL